MKKLLVIVDMRNDFITGSLGTSEAVKTVPAVRQKLEEAKNSGWDIVFTRDTHSENYLSTQEGKKLPVPHCITGTPGHDIERSLDTKGARIIDKASFGSLELADYAAEGDYGEIELCGLCTDICVVSNALILKARLPEATVTVDARATAGVTPESRDAALLTMKMCQIYITGI